MNHSWSVPKGTIIMYPRTQQDAIAEAATVINGSSDVLLAQGAYHDGLGSLALLTLNEDVRPTMIAPGTDEDTVAELEAAIISDNRWNDFAQR